MFGGAPPRMLNSVVVVSCIPITTESQRTQRLHREEIKSGPHSAGAELYFVVDHVLAGLQLNLGLHCFRFAA